MISINIGLVHIHRCYSELAAKSKISKVMGFKKYLEYLPNLRWLEGASPSANMSIKVKNQGMKLS